MHQSISGNTQEDNKMSEKPPEGEVFSPPDNDLSSLFDSMCSELNGDRFDCNTDPVDFSLFDDSDTDWAINKLHSDSQSSGYVQPNNVQNQASAIPYMESKESQSIKQHTQVSNETKESQKMNELKEKTYMKKIKSLQMSCNDYLGQIKKLLEDQVEREGHITELEEKAKSVEEMKIEIGSLKSTLLQYEEICKQHGVLFGNQKKTPGKGKNGAVQRSKKAYGNNALSDKPNGYKVKEEFVEEHKALERQYNKIKEEYKDLDNKYKNLETEMSQMKKDAEVGCNKCRCLENEITQREKHIERLLDNNRNLENQKHLNQVKEDLISRQEMSEVVAERDQKVCEILNHCKSLENEKARVECEVKRLVDRLKVSENEKDALKHENKGLADAYKILESNMATIKLENKEKSEKCKNFESEVAMLKGVLADNKVLLEEKKYRRQYVEKLRSEIQDLEKSLDAMQNQLRSKKNKISELETVIHYFEQKRNCNNCHRTTSTKFDDGESQVDSQNKNPASWLYAHDSSTADKKKPESRRKRSHCERRAQRHASKRPWSFDDYKNELSSLLRLTATRLSPIRDPVPPEERSTCTSDTLCSQEQTGTRPKKKKPNPAGDVPLRLDGLVNGGRRNSLLDDHQAETPHKRPFPVSVCDPTQNGPVNNKTVHQSVACDSQGHVWSPKAQQEHSPSPEIQFKWDLPSLPARSKKIEASSQQPVCPVDHDTEHPANEMPGPYLQIVEKMPSTSNSKLHTNSVVSDEALETNSVPESIKENLSMSNSKGVLQHTSDLNNRSNWGNYISFLPAANKKESPQEEIYPLEHPASEVTSSCLLKTEREILSASHSKLEGERLVPDVTHETNGIRGNIDVAHETNGTSGVSNFKDSPDHTSDLKNKSDWCTFSSSLPAETKVKGSSNQQAYSLLHNAGQPACETTVIEKVPSSSNTKSDIDSLVHDVALKTNYRLSPNSPQQDDHGDQSDSDVPLCIDENSDCDTPADCGNMSFKPFLIKEENKAVPSKKFKISVAAPTVPNGLSCKIENSVNKTSVPNQSITECNQADGDCSVIGSYTNLTSSISNTVTKMPKALKSNESKQCSKDVLSDKKNITDVVMQNGVSGANPKSTPKANANQRAAKPKNSAKKKNKGKDDGKGGKKKGNKKNENSSAKVVPPDKQLHCALECLEQLRFKKNLYKKFRHSLECTIQNPSFVPSSDFASTTIITFLSSSKRNPLLSYVETTDPSVLTPHIENCIAEALISVDKKKKIHLCSLVETFMQMLQDEILRNQELQIYALSCLCRVYTLISRFRQQLDDARMLVFQLLRSGRGIVYHAVASMVGICQGVVKSPSCLMFFDQAYSFVLLQRPSDLSDKFWKECCTVYDMYGLCSISGKAFLGVMAKIVSMLIPEKSENVTVSPAIREECQRALELLLVRGDWALTRKSFLEVLTDFFSSTKIALEREGTLIAIIKLIGYVDEFGPSDDYSCEDFLCNNLKEACDTHSVTKSVIESFYFELLKMYLHHKRTVHAWFHAWMTVNAQNCSRSFIEWIAKNGTAITTLKLRTTTTRLRT